MGQMIQCDEGHWFDKSQHNRCPHCGVGPPDLTVKYRAAGRGSDDDDATQMYKAGAAPGRAGRADPDLDPDATVAVWRRDSGIDPVVGWLVCFEGPNQGRDYRVHSGRNVIGRDTALHICIAGDETISRKNHASIFFDPQDASFYINPEEGRSGVYVNGKVALQPTMLKAYDTVRVGATKLVFVPLCGDRFRWDKAQEAKPEQPVDPPLRKSSGESTTG